MKLLKKSDEKKHAIKLCMDYLKTNGGAKIPIGKHFVKDEDIYLIVSEYTSRSLKNSKWEAHKRYADIQIVLAGTEKIYVSNIDRMEVGEYNAEKDFVSCYGAPEAFYVLNPANAMLLMPEDAHMPGVSVDNCATNVKKAVFKIPVELLEV